MLPKPTLPFCPVKVKETVVIDDDWLVAIVMSDIWERLMFPLMAKLTVEPLLVFAGTITAFGGGVGVVRWIGVGLVWFLVCVGIGDGVGVCDVVVGVGLGDALGVGVLSIGSDWTTSVSSLSEAPYTWPLVNDCPGKFTVTVKLPTWSGVKYIVVPPVVLEK